MNNHKLAIIVGALCEAFRQKSTPATIMAYEWGLEGLTLEAIERAARQAMRQSKFMPSPAELRELAGELPPTRRAVLAWDAFRKALFRPGYDHTVDFDDPIINATVRNLGGWIRVGEEWDDRPAHEFDTWFRKEFERVYVSLFYSGVDSEAIAPLPGLYAIENARNGYEYSKIERIQTGLPVLPSGVLRDDRPERKFLESVKGIS